jgi:hypothetical protein
VRLASKASTRKRFVLWVDVTIRQSPYWGLPVSGQTTGDTASALTVPESRKQPMALWNNNLAAFI